MKNDLVNMKEIERYDDDEQVIFYQIYACYKKKKWIWMLRLTVVIVIIVMNFRYIFFSFFFYGNKIIMIITVNKKLIKETPITIQ